MRRGSIWLFMARCWCWSWRLRRAASPGCSPACVATLAARRAAMAELLRVENVSRRFGGLLAVNRASFAAEAGRITALIGPNGAGKTTLFAIITGFIAPSEGRIAYAGPDI